MRLFEVDQGSARDVLAVLQGLANKEGQASELPFPVVMNVLKPFGLGIGSPDGLIALKNEVDPAGDVFDISNDGKGTVILNTKVKDPEQQQALKKPVGPSVDKMASANAKDLTPNI